METQIEATETLGLMERIRQSAVIPIVITPHEAISLVQLAYSITLSPAEAAAITALLETMALFPPEFWTLVNACAAKLGRERMLQLMSRVFSQESARMEILNAADMLRLVADGDDSEAM